MQFVIAGSYAEYYRFLDNQGIDRKNSKYIFISDPMRLYGMRYVTILCTGNFWRSPVWEFWKDRLFPQRVIRFVDTNGRTV